MAQQPDPALPTAPSAVVRPLQLASGVVIPQETPGAMPLTLDQAITLGLKSNAQILIQGQQERSVKGQTLSVENALLPSLTASAYTRAQEINLAAMGFKPSALAGLSIPGFNIADIQEIVKVNTTNAQLALNQQLFNAPAYFLYKAAKKASDAATWNTLNVRGGVVLAVGGYYLRTLADQAQLKNAQALVKQDQLVYDHAKAERDAGVGINLDVLRAQVQLQNEQQETIRDEAAVAKDKIALNRQMGQPAGQELDLVDTVPFAEYTGLSLEDERALAFTRRKDLLGLQSQLDVATQTARAVKYERLPTVGAGGFYGVLGETTGLYHGVFAAQGKVQFPIFEEAELRGQKEVAQAQIIGLKRNIDGLKVQIEADIRSAQLDVDTYDELVKVARSNQDLSAQELQDATDRYKAGVDDDLPVVRAQATLQGAEAQVIQAEFQYNYAKLRLSRSIGVTETQYKQFLR
ncbi:TolC family protein [Granulicella tundricola]|uniref:TolC family protein n=1 Tax=Granulicella tundricola TaxID=940615 RepID=UPI001E5E98DA|nr:TolC family protein [Granulicella tundricola]